MKCVRVVDFTQIIAGPMATNWLATMGAEVIKVESKTRPDVFRRDPTVDPRVAWFVSVNYGKKGIVCNLSEPEGRALVYRLIAQSDFVFENFTTDTVYKLRLDYASLRRVRPDIIVVSISGFGRTGPARNYRAFAHVASAYAGLNYGNRAPDGKPKEMGGVWGDAVTSKIALFAALAALQHRVRTGEGQHLDIAMAEAMTFLLPQAHMEYALNGRQLESYGNREYGIGPQGVYRCRGEDEWLALRVETNEQWEALCHLMGRLELAKDPRFAEAQPRWTHHGELDRLIEDWTQSQDAHQAAESLQQVGIPATRVDRVSDKLTDPHLLSRQAFCQVPTRDGKPITLMKPPVRANSRFIGDVSSAAPEIGEQTEYAFRELLGMDKPTFERLRERRAIS